MKKIIIYISVIFFLTSIASCELETSGNGDLDGYWHLVTVDTLSTGGTANLKDSVVYWAVQHKLLQLSGTHGRFLLRFNHTADTLALSEPYTYDREDGDKPVEDATVLKPFGINSLNARFLIEKLNGSKMILSNDVVRLYFKKM
jgi:hypothetical protein